MSVHRLKGVVKALCSNIWIPSPHNLSTHHAHSGFTTHTPSTSSLYSIQTPSTLHTFRPSHTHTSPSPSLYSFTLTLSTPHTILTLPLPSHSSALTPSNPHTQAPPSHSHLHPHTHTSTLTFPLIPHIPSHPSHSSSTLTLPPTPPNAGTLSLVTAHHFPCSAPCLTSLRRDCCIGA